MFAFVHIFSHLLFLCLFNSSTAVHLPKFLEYIPNMNVTAGRDVELPCVVENIGSYKVAWTHIDRQILLTIDNTTVTLIPRFSIRKTDERTWSLHIKAVTPEDTGYYVCQVNMEPIINQVGYLQVVVPPKFLNDLSSPTHMSVREGMEVRLKCVAEGIPVPRVTWNREDGTHVSAARELMQEGHINMSGSQLFITKASRLDMGIYMCIATNKVPPSISRRVVLDVHFEPVITVESQLIGAPQSKSITLQCTVTAFPKAVHYWRFKGQLLINTTRQTTKENTSGHTTTLQLTIHNLLKGDYGAYLCGSKNSLGETEESLQLYEIKMPKERQYGRNKNIEFADVNQSLDSASSPDHEGWPSLTLDGAHTNHKLDDNLIHSDRKRLRYESQMHQYPKRSNYTKGSTLMTSVFSSSSSSIIHFSHLYCIALLLLSI